MNISCCARDNNSPLADLLVEFQHTLAGGKRLKWVRHKVRNVDFTMCGVPIPNDALAMLPDCWADNGRYRDCKEC